MRDIEAAKDDQRGTRPGGGWRDVAEDDEPEQRHADKLAIKERRHDGGRRAGIGLHDEIMADAA